MFCKCIGRCSMFNWSELKKKTVFEWWPCYSWLFLCVACRFGKTEWTESEDRRGTTPVHHKIHSASSAILQLVFPSHNLKKRLIDWNVYRSLLCIMTDVHWNDNLWLMFVSFNIIVSYTYSIFCCQYILCFVSSWCCARCCICYSDVSCFSVFCL